MGILAQLTCVLVGHIWRLKLHADGRDGFVCARCQAMRIRQPASSAKR